MSTIDYSITNQGSIYLVRAENDAARMNLTERVQPDAQWFGGRLVVEHRYAMPLALELNREGWLVRFED
jgi:hypothetical protein